MWLIKFVAYQHSSCHAREQQDLHHSRPGLVLPPALTVAGVPWNLCLCATFVVSRPDQLAAHCSSNAAHLGEGVSHCSWFGRALGCLSCWVKAGKSLRVS